MIKVMIFIRRRSDLSVEAFREHYESVHVRLSFEHLPLMLRHARNYPAPLKGQAEPDYDCVTECWFEDWEAMKQTSALLAAEKRALITEDEARFMDRDSIRLRVVEEHVTERTGGPGGAYATRGREAS